MELYEQIRREYELGVGTIQGVAQKLGVHRRMVRDAVANALPARRKKPQRPRTKLGPATGFIDAILVTDRKEPRKQRHTAHRIWQRVREELNVEVAERTVRQYVEQRKRELGVETAEVFVPQSYGWGQQAQVDWYEAWVELGGERVKLQVFAMRAMASGAAFHRAYRRATQQAFLEAHEEAFAYFGGVFRQLRYDNLKAAVKRVLRGSRREETARFLAFRSHWRFEAEFCTPARGNEKGGVEGEVGRFRRNHLVPVPRAESLDELNARLLDCCRRDEQRTVAGQTQRVGERLEIERESLLGLAAEGFEIEATSFPTVDGSGCVKVRTNFYSTPLRPGTKTQAKIFAETVEVWQRRPLRGAARAQLQPATEGLGSGALSGSVGAQAGSAGRIDGAGAVAAARPLAGELRPVVGRADAASRQAARDRADAGAARGGQAARLDEAAAGDRAGARVRLRGPGGGALSAGRRAARAGRSSEADPRSALCGTRPCRR